MQAQQQDKHAELRAFVDSLNLTYSAMFIPESKAKPRENKNVHGLNWRLSLGSKDKGENFMITDYWQGEGRIPHYDRRDRKTVDGAKYIREVCESGKYLKTESRFGWLRLPAPKLIDVLYSLTLDSEAIECTTFEDWASNYGYDTDSRKAEAVYRACLEIGLKLRQLVGDSNLSKLRELFTDY